MSCFSFHIASCVILLTLVGCGGPQMDYGKVDLVGVHGKVTLDGQPLAEAVVTFEAPNGQFSYGLTDASGAYHLQFDSVMAGVTPGPKTVRISTTRKIVGLNAGESEGEGEGGEEPRGKKAAASSQDRVPARYNAKSELSVEVTAGQTEYNFDLSS